MVNKPIQYNYKYRNSIMPISNAPILNRMVILNRTKSWINATYTHPLLELKLLMDQERGRTLASQLNIDKTMDSFKMDS